ncbi:bifunctional metallophosphatase/5'-nucleotidase [Alteribacter keqinensis]|uniref:Bifunctional metallophosphatase/5'-nucleotidase n=1 Tax=Alteribacter keqinensis TaxID=2483800 RepID=A0A3M7TPF2_9BACI|nr:bifunctional UDP-sugar hydrolase/5'-nucleotidase [Alteribacter keqinensis]RNA67428.1 bifunctional metallophosphatase/5'-nucleotidase [Alteribacter keqinensis]
MKKKTLRILHTNDLHSQLSQWPAVVSKINELRDEAEEEGEEVLLFDIGDHADRVHPITEGLEGKGNVELLNRLRYDAVTIGNNEGMTFSKKQLDALYADAGFDVLVANLKDANGQKPGWAKSHRIFTTKQGVTVGVFGVTVAYKLFYSALGWSIEDPFEAIEEEVNLLKDQVDVLVCLSHLGLHDDERMAKQYPEIDLILGSHTHHLLLDGEKINETWIHQCGRSGSHFGDITISFDETSHSVSLVDIHTVEVDHAHGGRDKDTEDALTELQKRADDVLGEVVTTLPEDWELSWEKETPLSKLLVTGLRRWCEADVAMMNAGILLEGLKKGPVTKGTLHSICPHPINPAKVKLSGERLLEFIREAHKEEKIYKKVKGFGFRGKILGMMVYDGIDVLESPEGPLQPKDIRILGKPLDRSANYNVATVDMFTFGYLYPSISTVNEKTYYMPEFLRDVLAWSLRNIHLD